MGCPTMCFSASGVNEFVSSRREEAKVQIAAFALPPEKTRRVARAGRKIVPLADMNGEGKNKTAKILSLLSYTVPLSLSEVNEKAGLKGSGQTWVYNALRKAVDEGLVIKEEKKYRLKG